MSATETSSMSPVTSCQWVAMKRAGNEGAAGAGAAVSSLLVSQRGLQIALGVIWIFEGLLQAEGPKFSRDYPLGTLAQSVMGAPMWVNQSVVAGIHSFVSHWPLSNLGSVLLQVAIGAALVSGPLPARLSAFRWRGPW